MRFFSLLSLALVLTACGDTSTDAPVAETPVATAPTAGLMTDGAYARAAPSGGVSAVYLTIQNGAQADTLVSAQSDAAGRVEIHRTQDVGEGLSGMVPVEGGLAMAAGETVTMEPGGLHVMLLDLQRDLAEGDTLNVTLDFAGTGARTVRAPIRGM